MNYDNFELVPEEYCKGLKPGTLFLFSTDKPGQQRRCVGDIIYFRGSNPAETGCVQYCPEITPVANASMFKLSAVRKITQANGHLVIWLK